MQLTKIQKLAVEAIGKNILVAAGAGTGKTRVLVERFLHLIITGQALATEILALTFTEKAANEMKSRIFKRLKELKMEGARRDLEFAYISTIHAFASRILKEHPLEAGVDPDFRVIEEEEADLIKEQALDEIIEAGCENADGTFELLKTYTESAVRKGILRIFHTARIEGRSITQFFEDSRKNLSADAWLSEKEKMRQRVAGLFEQVGEKQLASEWLAFSKEEKWNWDKLDALKEWTDPFSYRRKEKEIWNEIKGLISDFRAAQIQQMAEIWRPAFEKIALAFEALYEARKKEKGFLDFDDLQEKVLAVLKKDHPAAKKLLKHYRQLFKFIMVDEFQDTNPLQMRFIELLASDGNLFRVGDYKQSIYGFRGVSPEHFLELEKCYEAGQEGVRIPLLENFRSQKPILDFVNFTFGKLWEQEFKFEELIPYSKKEEKTPEQQVELLVTELKEDEGIEQGRIREAARIASRIHELKEEGVPFGDIALLFQAMRESAIYEQALKNAGIPYFVVGGRGFYHQPEIRDMMSFLSCLENPLSDISLAATLRSPFFQVTDDTLFWLSKTAKEKDEMNPLFQGLKSFQEISEIPPEEKQKLFFFKALLEEFLREKDKMRLAELLDAILVKTSFELSVLADPQGVRKYANLRKLMDLAREYESRQIMTLGDFIRTIRHIENREVREAEAQIGTEKGGNVVRLMTVHAAKGLEFPVCFVADLAHQRQRSDFKTILAESGLGYAFQIRHEKTYKQEEPLFWKRIEERIRKREREEWKRLFYVALTRAENRLILSGVRKEIKNPKDSLNEMSSWMEWVLTLREEAGPLVKTLPDTAPVFIRKTVSLAEKLELKKMDFASGQLRSFWKEAGITPKIEADGENRIRNLFFRQKTASRSIDLPVSAYSAFQQSAMDYWRVYEVGYRGEIKRSEIWDEEETDATPADFGTDMHSVLERLNFRNPSENMERILKDIFRDEKEKKEEAGRLLKAFTGTPLFARLKRARQIYRELPFVLNQRHGRVNGVIDLLFEDETGGWHVLDYKTAEGNADKVIKAGYDIQIAIYALAVYQIMEVVPQSGILYFLKNQWSQTVSLNAASIQGFDTKLRKMQDEILEFNQNQPA